MNYQTSQAGWLLLCETCGQHTATIQTETQRYFCQQCFEEDCEEETEVVCDCGSEKLGLPCVDWCSTNK